MQIELRARRAYELGRARQAAARSLLLCAVAALLATLLHEGDLVRKLPFAFALWFGVQMWGRALLRGARLGLLAGFATILLPLSWLRPCCVPGLLASSEPVCTMPGVCVLMGALIGLGLAASMPRALLQSESRSEAAAGMVLGALTLVWLKCSLLLWGETLGLLAGLLAGVLALTFLRPVRAR